MEQTISTPPSLHATLPLHGKYKVRVSGTDGRMALSVLHVDQSWMPFALFGRVVLSRLLDLRPSNSNEVVDIQLTEKGVACERRAESSEAVAAEIKRLMILDDRLPVDVRHQAYSQIVKALHRTQRAPAKAVSRYAWVKWPAIFGTVLAVGYLILAVLATFSTPESSPAAAAPTENLTAVVRAQMSSAEFAQRAADAESPVTHAEAVASAAKIVLRDPGKGGKSVVVWSDPLCLHCRDFEQNVIAKLSPEIGVTVVPVAFRDGARPVVAYVACGDGAKDRMERWSGLMAAEPTGDLEKQCPAGPFVADANSMLFARAGLTRTPALMSADGARLYEGEMTLDAVQAWARQ